MTARGLLVLVLSFAACCVAIVLLAEAMQP